MIHGGSLHPPTLPTVCVDCQDRARNSWIAKQHTPLAPPTIILPAANAAAYVSLHCVPAVMVPAYCGLDPRHDVEKLEVKTVPFHLFSQTLKLPLAVLLRFSPTS